MTFRVRSFAGQGPRLGVFVPFACRLAAMVAIFGTADAAEPKRPPNVLFIVADDLRCGLGCYGDPEVKTPHIDRLAARGMRFERAYCQYPVCNPSRSSLLSGLRPDTTGILDNEIPLRRHRPDLVILPELFRKHGYFTASLGKIVHAGLDAAGEPKKFLDAPAFADNRNFEATAAGKQGTGRNLTGGSLKWCTWLAAEGTDADQPDGQLAAAAVKLLETPRTEPFFLAVGFHKPHDPFVAPQRYFDLYPLETLRLVAEPAARSPLVPLALPPGKGEFEKFTDRERREFRRAYYAGTSFMDAQVGKLLDALDRRELWDDTIVVFLGDHGYHLGEHGWWNKVTVFEHGAHAPLIVWAPGRPGMGKSARGLVEFVDLYPTLADLAGLKPPHALEGTTLRPLLDDPTLPGKPAAYTQVTRGKKMGRSVRTDRWRYTEWDGGAAGLELYDHAADPAEHTNLAERADLAAVRTELRTLLRKVGPAVRP